MLLLATLVPNSILAVLKSKSLEGAVRALPRLPFLVLTRVPIPVSLYALPRDFLNGCKSLMRATQQVNIYNNLQSYTVPGGPVWSG